MAGFMGETYPTSVAFHTKAGSPDQWWTIEWSDGEITSTTDRNTALYLQHCAM